MSEEVSGYLGRKKRKDVRIGWLFGRAMRLLNFSSQGHHGDISTSSELKCHFSKLQFSSVCTNLTSHPGQCKLCLLGYSLKAVMLSGNERSLHPSVIAGLWVGLVLLPVNTLHDLKDIVPWLEVATGKGHC